MDASLEGFTWSEVRCAGDCTGVSTWLQLGEKLKGYLFQAPGRRTVVMGMATACQVASKHAT